MRLRILRNDFLQVPDELPLLLQPVFLLPQAEITSRDLADDGQADRVLGRDGTGDICLGLFLVAQLLEYVQRVVGHEARRERTGEGQGRVGAVIAVVLGRHVARAEIDRRYPVHLDLLQDGFGLVDPAHRGLDVVVALQGLVDQLLQQWIAELVPPCHLGNPFGADLRVSVLGAPRAGRLVLRLLVVGSPQAAAAQCGRAEQAQIRSHRLCVAAGPHWNRGLRSGGSRSGDCCRRRGTCPWCDPVAFPTVETIPQVDPVARSAITGCHEPQPDDHASGTGAHKS